MILTKTEPFTLEEIELLSEEFDFYIKTVIDIEKRICSAGMSRHFEGEQLLLQEYASQQHTVWGGGFDTISKEIDFNSFINIRSRDNNPKNEIIDPAIRKIYQELTEYFFEEIL